VGVRDGLTAAGRQSVVRCLVCVWSDDDDGGDVGLVTRGRHSGVR